MAFQLGGTILAGTWLGQWLDAQMMWKTPVCTIVCALLAVAAGLYVSLKDFIQPR